METRAARRDIRKLRSLLNRYLENVENDEKIEDIKEFAESHPKIISSELLTSEIRKPLGSHLDEGAYFLLPPEYQNDHECLKSKEDGNCLFNGVSLILTGTEDSSIQLRLAVLCELISHSGYYLERDEFKKAITYSDKALDQGDSAPPEKKHEVRYFAQVMEMCEVGAWCTLLAMYGLSSVLERPINSIFPPVKNPLYEETFTREIKPRKDSKNKTPIMILWTNVSVTDEKTASNFLNEIAPSCNHFVPVFQKKKKTIPIKRQTPDDAEISTTLKRSKKQVFKTLQRNE